MVTIKFLMEFILNLDLFLFKLINLNGEVSFDKTMIFLSNKYVFIPLYIYILFILYKKFKSNFLWILLSIVFLIFLSDFGSVHFFKEIFQRLRPCHQLDEIRLVSNCGGLYSFISSHASNMFSIAFFIGLLTKNKKLFILLFSLATIIGYSRIYLGVHFPLDILGGMFWAIVVSLLSYKIVQYKIGETI